jgi:polysaccharide deacetylase family protein (PEP-CTERM system associated)
MRVLTFDIEDWFHLLEHRLAATPEDWQRFPSRIEHSTDRLLQLLRRHQVRATFFCLGWVARRHPDLIRRIAAEGHDIGSHSDQHELATTLGPAAFERDLASSLAALEILSGAPVRYYRAPGFSIGARTPWVVESLIRHGIEVDCSIFPGRHAHGGMTDALATPHWLQTRAGRIRELPVSATTLLGTRIFCGGGGYFRLAPYALVRRHLRRDPYAMTYFHPRDFDAEQPRMPGLNAVRRFKSYVGIGSAFEKLDRMLGEFEFHSVREAVAATDWQAAPTFALDPSPSPSATPALLQQRRV